MERKRTTEGEAAQILRNLRCLPWSYNPPLATLTNDKFNRIAPGDLPELPRTEEEPIPEFTEAEVKEVCAGLLEDITNYMAKSL